MMNEQQLYNFINDLQQMKKNNKLAIRIEQQNTDSPFSNEQSYLQPLRPVSHPDEEQDKILTEHQHASKVIEFQEFLIEDDKELPKSKNTNTLKPSQDPVKKTLLQGRPKSKREFLIDIPQSKSFRNRMSVESSSIEKQDYKEPPAPSNKKSIQAKNFIFPIPSQKQNDSKQKDQTHYNIEQLLKNFDKQRQQFYRQKSNFQKQLLVKQGQIQMLQKMLTGRIGHEQHSLLNHNYQYYESLIIQKDIQINELLQKIQQLSKQLSQRAQDLRQVKMELNKLQNVNESLLHQMYLVEKKEVNKKTTQQFYQLKRQKATTPTSRNWEYQSKKEEMRYSGFSEISEIQKRIQNLKNNRQEFEDRKKIKSELNYTQPARFKQFYELGYNDYSKGPKY